MEFDELEIGGRIFCSFEELEEYAFWHPEIEEAYDAEMYRREVKTCVDTYYERAGAEYGDGRYEVEVDEDGL